MSESEHSTHRCDRSEESLTPARSSYGRRVVFRDVVVFQLKLFISGWLHFLLSPATLTAAFLDLIWKSNQHESRFHRVLDWGHRAEEALGLFATLGDDAKAVCSDATDSTAGE